MDDKRVTSTLLFLGMLIWVACVLAAAQKYMGEVLTYILFSASFLALLVSAFYKNNSYTYLFVSVFLWLGFWVKLSVHILVGYNYVEPIGGFDGAPSSWDQVLWVSIVACWGVLLGKVLCMRVIAKKDAQAMVSKRRAAYPFWYPKYRKWLWSGVLIFVLVVASVNMLLGIQQIGLVARTILPWPLNGVIAWFVSIGSAISLATLVWWDISLNKPAWLSALSILFEAFFSTASLLSRGAFIFHAAPQLFGLYKNRWMIRGGSYSQALVIGVLFMTLLFLSVASVTTLRGHFYPHAGGFTTADQVRLTRLEVLEGAISHVKTLISEGEPQEKHLQDLLKEQEELRHPLNTKQGEEKAAAETVGRLSGMPSGLLNQEVPSEHVEDALSNFTYQIQEGAIKKVMTLVVDRWVGLEGVMAVASYPEKGKELIFDALAEKREIGQVTKYQSICKSKYQWTDSKTWQFASLPGAVAFLYFSGSLWVVFLGMTALILFIQSVEFIVYKLTYNPILCSLLGMVFANFVAQFGVTPRQDLPYFLMIMLSIAVIAVIQKKHSFLRDERET